MGKRCLLFIGIGCWLFSAAAVYAEEGTPVWTLAAKAIVLAQLRDTTGVKFLDVRKIDGNVCGSFNAKNGYGGYNGYLSFAIVTPEQVTRPDSVFDNIRSEAIIIGDTERTRAAIASLCVDR